MPTYRSITTSLVSQFDILIIPEYEPPKTPIDPFLNAPTLINHDHSLVSVYIPTYPSSQFWLCYSIAPPYPPKMLYYFKLYINKTHIVSWGCGEEDGYEGKTMFGLFDPGPSSSKLSQIERRVLCFAPENNNGNQLTSDNLSDVLEVKVFRSKGRKRMAPELKDFRSVSGVTNVDRNKSQRHSSGNGINLVNGGSLPEIHPRRFYRYALLDPLNQPFATFRYYYRSWDQLEALGVISPPASTESSSIHSRTPVERTLSPKSSSTKTIDSYVSVATYPETNSANSSSDTIKRPANDGSYAVAEEDTIHSDSPEQDFSSPLRAQIDSVPFFPRPPTPPSFATPSKVAQLPPTIPQTDNTLNTLASKESFTSLIRNRFPSPDPSAFQLHELILEPKPPSPMPLRNRSTSMSTLLGVVSSARSRRRRRTDESGESEGEQARSGEEKGNDQKSEDEMVGVSEGEEGTRVQRLVEKERRQRKKDKRRERVHSDGGSSGSGSGSLEEGRRRKEQRKLNLWEQL